MKRPRSHFLSRLQLGFSNKPLSINYIATDQGWVYLAAVTDLFSRQVMGWSGKDQMQTSVVKDALTMAH